MIQREKRKEGGEIAVASTGPNLNSLVDFQFGRCAYFLIVDQNGKLIDSISNQGQQAQRGAGVAAAQAIVDSKVTAVITGNVGPNAYSILNSARIRIFTIDSEITISEVLEKYKKDELKEVVTTVERGSSFGPQGYKKRGLGRGPRRNR